MTDDEPDEPLTAAEAYEKARREAEIGRSRELQEGTPEWYRKYLERTERAKAAAEYLMGVKHATDAYCEIRRREAEDS